MGKTDPFTQFYPTGFGWKTDKIAKFSILDGKTEFTILDGIWTKDGQMANRSWEKMSNSFTLVCFTIMFSQLV